MPVLCVQIFLDRTPLNIIRTQGAGYVKFYAHPYFMYLFYVLYMQNMVGPGYDMV